MRLPRFDARASVQAIRTFKNFPLFFFDAFGLVHGDLHYRLRGSNLDFLGRGDTPDHYEIMAVVAGWEYDLTSIPSKQAPVIFDLGGHIGSFALYAGWHYRNMHPRIFVFEPSEKNFRYLETNIRKNPIPGVAIKLEKAALSDKTGTASLDTSGANDAYHLKDPSEASGSSESTRTVTLADAVAAANVDRVDVLKMDIEGGEYILLSHKPTLQLMQRTVSYLFMEFHELLPHHKGRGWVKEVLSQHGFIMTNETPHLLYFKNSRL